MLRNKTVADYPHLVAQWHPTRNGDLKPEDVSYGSGQKVWWKCRKGTWPDGSFADDHEWEAAVCNRTNGRGCPCCLGRKVVPSNCLATTHPELAKEWHPTKNGGLTPYDVIGGDNKKRWWKCYEGKWPDGSFADDHEWEAAVCDRTGGRSCPCCSGHKVVPSNCLAMTHPELAEEWHPTKNGDKPEDVAAGSNKKRWWKCHEGTWPDGTFADDHEWESTVNNRKNGNGCPCCSGHKVVPSNCLAITHPDLVQEWHPANDLTPYDVVGSRIKVMWKCHNGTWPDGTFADDHEWEAVICDRTNGNGCPCCSPSKKVVPSNCLTTIHPELAKQWHPTKNEDLKPEDVSYSSGQKVWWKCYNGKWPDGSFADDHEWKSAVCDRTGGKGCPRCKESKGEKEVARILDKHGIRHRRQWAFTSCKNINPLPFDFVVHHQKRIFLIEFQGEQHYEAIDYFGGDVAFERRQIHDTIKRKWCQEKDCPLLEIPYWHFDRIEKLVVEFIE